MSGKRAKRIRQLIFIAVHATKDEDSEAAFKELKAMDPTPQEVGRADRLREERVKQKLINAGIPIKQVLPCPRCFVLHVDRGEWETRKHRAHLCLKEDGGCGYEWQPEAHYTVGVTPPDQEEAPVIRSKSAVVMR